MKVKQINIRRMLLSIVSAYMIIFCTSPYFGSLQKLFIKPTEVQIEVLPPKEVGRGNEVWIAQILDNNTYYDLQNNIKRNQVNGILEYREKEKFQYTYDFLVSYGENSGTKFTLYIKPNNNANITFWKTKDSGSVKITTDYTTQIVDLSNPASESGELISIYLFNNNINKMFNYFYIGIVFMVLVILIYYVVKVINNKGYLKIEDKVNKEEGRNIAIDLIKTMAVLFVLSTHFLWGAGYYQTPIASKIMILMTFMRWGFLICVPLFMIATGYLNRDKQLNRKYYKGLINVILLYLVVIVLKILLEKYYFGAHRTIGQVIKVILSLEYAWYINMYIGMFLLIPFLNLIWHNIFVRKHHEVLIFILLGITSLSTITNNLTPNYWVGIYPVTYYFIGTYLRTYTIKVNRVLNVMVIIFLLILQTGYSVGKCYNKVFDLTLFGGFNSSYNGFMTLVIAVLFFILLQDIKISSRNLIKLIISISKYSLEIYLFGALIFDQISYTIAQRYLTTPQEYLPYYLILISISLVLSLIVGRVVRYLINKIVMCCYKKWS